MPVKRSGKQDHTTTNGTTGAVGLSFFVFPGPLRCKATEATFPRPHLLAGNGGNRRRVMTKTSLGATSKMDSTPSFLSDHRAQLIFLSTGSNSASKITSSLWTAGGLARKITSSRHPLSRSPTPKLPNRYVAASVQHGHFV